MLFFRRKSLGEKTALQIERLLLAQESAYESRNWHAFIYYGEKVLPLLRRMHVDTDWTEDQLFSFLQSRALCKSLSVPGYREKMEIAQHEARAFY